jgi:hypothetical protein
LACGLRRDTFILFGQLARAVKHILHHNIARFYPAFCVLNVMRSNTKPSLARLWNRVRVQNIHHVAAAYLNQVGCDDGCGTANLRAARNHYTSVIFFSNDGSAPDL